MRNALIASLVVLVTSALARAQLVVHEWGTFTSLQDETDRAIGGINTDDEPVPAFVHRAVNLIQSGDDSGKGIPANDPEVTMRLETPVIYFHLPPGSKPQSVDVDVSFHAGWLTEFFPNANSTQPGLDPSAPIGHLTPETTGTLAWHKVQIGRVQIGRPVDEPQTSDPVWTSPRNVKCDPIQVGGEAEKFLFYRGVGHLDSPLSVTRVPRDRHQIDIAENDAANNIDAKNLWLVNVRLDGQLAWQHAQPVNASSSPIAVANDRFNDADYSDGSSLRKELCSALIARGLFRDEADALLNTWQQSYFKNPGLRLFFLVDPAWTNRVLPLHITGNPATTRVMVGRIELVTPEQRNLIEEMTARSPPAPNLPLKSAYPEYEQLGRFRNALLFDYLSQHPNAVLRSELQGNGITAFQIR